MQPPGTILARHCQQHPKLTERRAPSILKALAELGRISRLLGIFILPADFEIREYRSCEAAGDFRDYSGELCFTERFERANDLICIAFTK